MKIRALRVREVSAFRDPVALENLSGGLDVLAGPNELGKSTLLRALEAAFFAEHRTTRADLKRQLTPDTGGAPVIEVDFELAGARYRLRKRFFSAPKASLAGLDDGSLARGPDADARLSELLAKAGGLDRLQLLWVRQTRSLEPFAVEAGTRAGLKGLIERELMAAAGGERVHAVREKVRERMGALVTGGRRQPRGPYREALDTRARLAAEVEELRRKVEDGRARLDRLAGLRRTFAELSEPGAKALRTERTATARQTLETARAAADKRRAAEEAWKRLDREAAAAAAALTEFDRRQAEAGGLQAVRAQTAEKLAQARAAQTSAGPVLDEAAATAEALAAAERDLQTRIDAARRTDAARAALTVLRKRAAEAEALDDRIAGLKGQLAASRATPELLRTAEAAGSAMATLEARLATVSVRVRIDYDAGSEGRISRDGRPVVGGAEQSFAEPVELVVAGIGRIRIAPAAAEDGQGRLAADLSQRKDAFAGLLGKAGVADLPALREAAARHSALSADLDRAAARLSGTCPEGVDALNAEIERLTDELPAETAGPAALTADLAALSAKRKSAGEAHRAAVETMQRAALAAARLETELSGHDRRLADLIAALPPAETAGAHRAAMAEGAETAAARSREAVVTLAALREREPGPEKLAQLERDLTAALAAETGGADKLNAAAREMAALELLLNRDALDGIGGQLAEREEALAAAGRQADALAREAAALALIDAEFDRAEGETRARYLDPLTERLTPYLGTLLPGAGVELGEAFEATALRRGGRGEPLAQLSHGTQEQIAVVVRLGLARLIADAGEPLPLILDDALVFADDDRIVAAFAALREASACHQVIVLTCRTKAFEALGGARLQLKPWQGFEE